MKFMGWVPLSYWTIRSLSPPNGHILLQNPCGNPVLLPMMYLWCILNGLIVFIDTSTEGIYAGFIRKEHHRARKQASSSVPYSSLQKKQLQCVKRWHTIGLHDDCLKLDMWDMICAGMCLERVWKLDRFLGCQARPWMVETDKNPKPAGSTCTLRNPIKCRYFLFDS